MPAIASFAIPERLHSEALIFEARGVTILASMRGQSGRCPECGWPSGRVRGHYRRTVADLPWAGVPVTLCVRVRKFRCENPCCPRKIFAERLEGIAARYARRTDRQREALESIGLALGGEAGARLASELGHRTSPDTLLRCIKRATDTGDGPVRVLGIDDWCWRRRLRYGTILVDLECHRVVDLLPDREVESVVEWLRAHPGIETIVRDRGDTYAEAASEGAPQAVQVVDRWHILKNLVDYLERFLLRHTRLLKGAAPILAGIQQVEQPPAQRPTPRLEEAAAASEEISKAYELTEDFCAMLRRLEGERLDGWMEAVRESQIAELDRFARSLKKDEAAVRAGLTLQWSQGQTEGQVHRLKLVKRQGYGRVGFELLRSRVLHAA